MRIPITSILRLSYFLGVFFFINGCKENADKSVVDDYRSAFKTAMDNFPTEVEIDTSTLISESSKGRIKGAREVFLKISTMPENISEDAFVKLKKELSDLAMDTAKVQTVLALRKPKMPMGQSREDCVNIASTEAEACKTGCGANGQCQQVCIDNLVAQAFGCAMRSPQFPRGAYEF